MKVTLLFILIPVLCFAEFVEIVDRQGRSIAAELVNLEMGEITFMKKDGVRYTVPLAILSDKSRDLIQNTFSKQNQFSEKISTNDSISPASDEREYSIEGLRISFGQIKSEMVNLKIRYNDRSIWEKSILSEDLGRDIVFSAVTDFSEVPKKGYSNDQVIFLFISAEGYAPQWHRLIKDGNSLSLEEKVKLYHKKYAVIEYEYYAGNERSFSGREPTHKGVAAVEHWGSIPGFESDWQIWQGGEDDLWGDNLLLDFHRGNRENGAIKTRLSFKKMKKAPADGYINYGTCGESSMEIRKGDRFFSRITGHTESTRGYGKIWIKDIVEQVPPGMEVFGK